MSKLYPEIKVHPPGPKGKLVIEKDRKYSSPSYIKAYDLVVDHGEGPWIYDVDGNRYLDMMAGIATASTGHSHPQVVEAIKKAADKFLHICGTDFFYESMSDIVEKLAGYVAGMGPKKVFLTNSGTEAIEGAIKLARYHTKRSNIIAFNGSFHGRTTGAIALTSSKIKYRAHFGPLMPGIYHVPFCNPYSDLQETENASPAIKHLEEELFTTLVSPSEVAAILLEPILGEGGYIPPTKFFLKSLRRICDEHGIMLVYDEVQSGVGRTGQMYASEHYGVFPDIYCTAKGLASGMPLGAIVAKASVMTWSRGTHGSTYGGNPVACAASLATLNIVEGLLPHVRQNGEILLTKLRKLQERFPVIGNVRGFGYMVGVEFNDPKTKEAAHAYMEDLEQLSFSKGVLLLGCGASTIRLAPPLVVGQHEFDIMISTLEECMFELNKKYKH
ncbi:MAG: acetyl ornithine aminotransferase family protein [Bdellovibrionota bacterium]